MGSNLKQAISDEVASAQEYAKRIGIPEDIILEKHGQVAVLAHGHVLGRAYARRMSGAIRWFVDTAPPPADKFPYNIAYAGVPLRDAIGHINAVASLGRGVSRAAPQNIANPLPPTAPPPAPADRWVPAGSGSTLAEKGRVVARVYKQGKYYHVRLYPGDERYGPYDTMAEAKTAAEWRVALES